MVVVLLVIIPHAIGIMLHQELVQSKILIVIGMVQIMLHEYWQL